MTKIRKRLSKKKEDKGKWVIDLEMHNAAQRPACEGVFQADRDVYEEARQNKAYYDSCRQNVINGERAEHMRKSLFWLGLATLFSGATFCWCVTWKIFVLSELFIMPALILIGLAFVSTGVHLWYERKIKKLVNVK